MVRLNFDVNNPIDSLKRLDTALGMAQLLWEDGIVEIDDFEIACEWATVDRETYDNLWAWAVSQSELDSDKKVQLFDALVRRPPHKSKGRTAYMELRLRYIASELHRKYGLNQGAAADVLADLSGTPARARIRNIITARKRP